MSSVQYIEILILLEFIKVMNELIITFTVQCLLIIKYYKFFEHRI